MKFLFQLTWVLASSSMSVCSLGFFPVQITEHWVRGCCVYFTYGIQHFKASSQYVRIKEWKKPLLNLIHIPFTTCWLLGDSWSTEARTSCRWKSISFQVCGLFICYTWSNPLIPWWCVPPTVRTDEEYPVYRSVSWGCSWVTFLRHGYWETERRALTSVILNSQKSWEKLEVVLDKIKNKK